ncbi:small acid-soluble spore protein SspI [Salinibacillus xinjiangensis]|uniref:Small, acid-soluble spore protein I n=1 Tax=Salinibacillus xinjiangensis TaxID=1229268 RepID=A0A6G1X9P6_9BACI|nr:small acid-soluble spore protein SspI [Salinibacillus xinjiangensis]MRG87649.1 small acid-soluble spore protein SspI [Salinibacillus xinjiangensis]
MDLDLRKAVLHNISGNNTEQLEATIVDAIQGGEEKTLPGLGVIFEVYWNNADESEKEEVLEVIEEGLKK